MEIEYKVNCPITSSQYIELVNKSVLCECRSTESEITIKEMLDNSNLIVTAWVDDQLVGIARALTDFHCCCYVSDLAVDESVQSMGVDKYLILVAAESVAETCKIVLLSAPKAEGYYSKIGFKEHNNVWVLTDISELVLP